MRCRVVIKGFGRHVGLGLVVPPLPTASVRLRAGRCTWSTFPIPPWRGRWTRATNCPRHLFAAARCHGHLPMPPAARNAVTPSPPPCRHRQLGRAKLVSHLSAQLAMMHNGRAPVSVPIADDCGTAQAARWDADFMRPCGRSFSTGLLERQEIGSPGRISRPAVESPACCQATG